jgi:hypothetical protein
LHPANDITFNNIDQADFKKVTCYTQPWKLQAPKTKYQTNTNDRISQFQTQTSVVSIDPMIVKFWLLVRRRRIDIIWSLGFGAWNFRFAPKETDN